MMFYNFLNEVASYGFFIIAPGNPDGPSTMPNPSAPSSGAAKGMAGMMAMANGGLIDNLNWAGNNSALLKKYGNVDITQVIAAGQSCGTMQSVRFYLVFHKDQDC
jgi:hypothetical protein